MRTSTAWNDHWEYTPFWLDDLKAPGAIHPEGVLVRLPHTNQVLPYGDFSEADFQFVSGYRKLFRPGPEHRRQRAWLTFEGAMAYAQVFLNGTLVAEHKGGYTAFRCDLTESLRWDEENVLAVRLDSTERPEIPPFGSVIDYLTYGGLYREVRWDWVGPLAVENLFVRPRKVLEPTTVLAVEAFLDCAGLAPGPVTARFCLREGAEVRHRWDQSFDATGKPQTVVFEEPVSGMALWSVDDPRLHTLEVGFVRQGEVLDRVTRRFGFRQAEFTPGGFVLNGRALKLRGLNRHQSFPYVGYAMPRSAQYKDAEILRRDLGVNMVRSSHYPPSRHFLDRCDELGLLVFDEIPGWQHIGGDEWQALALAQVGEMIRQAWNHPSIVLWGVRINESPDHEFYQKTNALARSLDPTRATGGVRDFAGSQFWEDVYTFNDFSHDRGREILRRPRQVAGARVPFLVTEHNGHMFPTKKFDPEAKRTEHALRHLRVLDRMEGDPAMAGALGWCMNDYNTHKDCGSGDRICYHGVLDAFRIPKPAAGAYASQQDAVPYLEVTSSMVPGEYERADLPAVVVLTNCDFLRVYRNGEDLGPYSPDRKTFPHLRHPPVIVDDLIGNRIETHERFSPRDAQRIKTVLKAVVTHGENHLPLRVLLTMAWVMVKYRMGYGEAADLFKKYVANWGQKLLVWEFEGWMAGKPVLRVKKGPHDQDALSVAADTTELVDGETWDSVRVVLRHVDENGNVLAFSNEALTLEVDGPAEILGPRTVALIGGSRAVWIRTLGTPGVVTLSVKSDRFPTQTLAFTVTLEAAP